MRLRSYNKLYPHLPLELLKNSVVKDCLQEEYLFIFVHLGSIFRL